MGLVGLSVKPTRRFPRKMAQIGNFAAVASINLKEDDREPTIILLYGFAIEEKEISTISPEAVQVAIVTTIIDFVDKPYSNVHEILSEKMSHSK